MKIVIKYALLLGLVVGLLWLGYGIVHKITTKNAVKERISQLPTFVFEGLDGKPVSSKSFKNKPLWLLYFDSSCEFCQMQLKEIQQNSQQLNDVQLLLVSAESVAGLRLFSQKYGFDTLQNLSVVRDSTHQCIANLGMTSTPSSLLYGADGRLIKKHSGIIKTTNVIKAFGHEQ